MKAKYLLWLDYESTGSRDDNALLEVGCLLTTPVYPYTILAEYSSIMCPVGHDIYAEMPDVVLEMHQKNGLLADIEAALSSDSGCPTPRAVELEIIGMLDAVGRKHEFMIAGSGVGHFDRRMMKHWMSELDSWLQYPPHDVGCQRRERYMAGRPDLIASGQYFGGHENQTHRALDDIKDHRLEAITYAEQLRSLPEVK